MNSPIPRTDAERSEYLRKVLQLNPLQRAEEILALRNRFRGICSPAAERAAAERDPRELRQQAQDGLQQVREHFWKEKLSTLQQTLDALPLKDFPDLRKAGQRLKVMAQHRQDFPALAEEPGFDPNLFGRLKQILVLPPRDAGPLKEAVQESFAEPRARKQALKMLALLERELPPVYKLEADWFDLLRSASAARWARRPLEPGSSGGTSPLRYLWALVPVAFAVLMAVVAPDSRSARNRQEPGTLVPAFAQPRPTDAPSTIQPPLPSESMQRALELIRKRQAERRGEHPAGPPENPLPFAPPQPPPRNP